MNCRVVRRLAPSQKIVIVIYLNLVFGGKYSAKHFCEHLDV